MVDSIKNYNSEPPNTNLSVQALHLLQSSLSYSARKSYPRSWELFCQYFNTYNIKVTMPLQIAQVCNCIGHLFWKQYRPSSIASHVSAINYVHRLLQLNDHTNYFIVRKLIKDCNNLSGTIDTRLPITMHILKNIMQGIEPAVQDFYLRIMLRAIFLFAFHALLRLGEIVAKFFNVRTYLFPTRMDTPPVYLLLYDIPKQ